MLGVGDALDVRQGDYASAALTGGVRWRRWDLSLVLDNLTNARGNRFAYGNLFLLASRRQTTPFRPINLEVRVSAGW